MRGIEDRRWWRMMKMRRMIEDEGDDEEARRRRIKVCDYRLKTIHPNIIRSYKELKP